MKSSTFELSLENLPLQAVLSKEELPPEDSSLDETAGSGKFLRYVLTYMIYIASGGSKVSQNNL